MPHFISCSCQNKQCGKPNFFIVYDAIGAWGAGLTAEDAITDSLRWLKDSGLNIWNADDVKRLIHENEINLIGITNFCPPTREELEKAGSEILFAYIISERNGPKKNGMASVPFVKQTTGGIDIETICMSVTSSNPEC
jgi:hypothetical protein